MKMGKKKTPAQLDREVAAALAESSAAPARRGEKAQTRRSKKSPYEVRAARVRALRDVMVDAVGDDGWLEADLADIERWIDVDDELSDREWIAAAKDQLLDNSVLPEHAGAPPENVRAWNDAFISTYLMNVDDGMGRDAAVDSARQNANDSVELTANERALTRTDPDLYEGRQRRRWW